MASEQRLERLAAIEVQVLAVRQRGIAVALDEAALVALHPSHTQPGARHRAHRSDGAGCETLSNTDLGLRAVFRAWLAKRFPHVHRRHLGCPHSGARRGLLRTAPGLPACVPRRRTRIGRWRSRSLTTTRVVVALRMAIRPRRSPRGGRHRVTTQLFGHIQLVQVLYRRMVQPFGPGDRSRSSCGPVPRRAAHNAPLLPRVARQPVQVLHAHPAIRTAAHPLEFKLNANPPAPRSRARATRRSWIEQRVRLQHEQVPVFLRRSVATRTSGSPNTPLSLRRRPESGETNTATPGARTLIDVSFH